MTTPEPNTPVQEEFFQNISSEENVTEIESLCMNCELQGTTRLLLTRIPHFKEVVLMSFSCPHCGYHNAEIQPSGMIQEKGKKIQLKLLKKQDLNRQVVKMESASIQIPELQFEIPSVTQKGNLNTIEGFIATSVENLRYTIEQNKDNPDVVLKLTEFISKLEGLLSSKENSDDLETPFTIILDDPAGNSDIQNFLAPATDPQLTSHSYNRTKEQDLSIGIFPPEEPKSTTPNILSATDAQKLIDTASSTPNEVIILPGTCSLCHKPGESRMLMIDIPYFKEVVVMAYSCEHCGYKTNEVKPGGAISAKGKKISLKLTTPEDISRDILKSETARIEFPEIDLVLEPGTLGGKFTTIEGLLTNVFDQIKSSSFICGDSADDNSKQNMETFLDSLKKTLGGDKQLTLVIDDPVANSYIQNIYAPDPDPNMTIEEYERSFEQNEELGLNDICTENYN